MTSVLFNNGWLAFLTILHVIAITLTGWRYYCRLTAARLWLDDHCALVALFLDLAFFITLWIEMKFPIYSYRSNLIILWIKIVFFTGCVWASRMSIAMSIARVAPTGGRFGLRRHAYAVLIFFTSIAVGLIIWIGVQCTNSTPWFNQHKLQCQLSNALGTCILASSVLVDVFLVATPLILFWRIRLPRRQRNLILGGFAASIFSSIITALHMAIQFSHLTVGGHRWALLLFFGHVETTVTLFLCNFLILVAAVYKVTRHYRRSLRRRDRGGGAAGISTSARPTTRTRTSTESSSDGRNRDGNGYDSDPFNSATRTNRDGNWSTRSGYQGSDVEVYTLTQISDDEPYEGGEVDVELNLGLDEEDKLEDVEVSGRESESKRRSQVER